MGSLKDRLARAVAGESALGFDAAGRDQQRLAVLPIEQVEPDANQPRRQIGNVDELRDSIREHGLLQPIIVEPLDEGKRYRILAGHRRYQACKAADLTTISAIVRTVTEQSRLEIQIVENLQREGLNPIDEARAMQRLMTEFNLSQREMAKRLGKSLGAINESLRVLTLPEAIQTRLLSMADAPAKTTLLQIAKEPDPLQQQALFEKAVTGEVNSYTAKTAKKNQAEKKARKPNVRVLKLEDVTVVIRFLKKRATHEACLDALKRALLQEQRD